MNIARRLPGNGTYLEVLDGRRDVLSVYDDVIFLSKSFMLFLRTITDVLWRTPSVRVVSTKIA